MVEGVLCWEVKFEGSSFGPSSFSAGRDWLNPRADWLAAGFGENRDLFGTTKIVRMGDQQEDSERPGTELTIACILVAIIIIIICAANYTLIL